MLNKKQIWAIFLFEFKMGCKEVETTLNISNTFGIGTANNISAVEAQQRLEPWRWRAQCPAVEVDLRPIKSNHRSWSSYNYTRSC